MSTRLNNCDNEFLPDVMCLQQGTAIVGCNRRDLNRREGNDSHQKSGD